MPLKHLVCRDGVIAHLEDMARRVHVAKGRVLMLMKSYYLFMVERGIEKDVPLLSNTLVGEMFRLVTKSSRESNPKFTGSLLDYYHGTFKGLTDIRVLEAITVSRYHLKEAFNYAETEVSIYTIYNINTTTDNINIYAGDNKCQEYCQQLVLEDPQTIGGGDLEVIAEG